MVPKVLLLEGNRRDLLRFAHGCSGARVGRGDIIAKSNPRTRLLADLGCA